MSEVNAAPIAFASEAARRKERAHARLLRRTLAPLRLTERNTTIERLDMVLSLAALGLSRSAPWAGAAFRHERVLLGDQGVADGPPQYAKLGSSDPC